jgi:hypothetical protein
LCSSLTFVISSIRNIIMIILLIWIINLSNHFCYFPIVHCTHACVAWQNLKCVVKQINNDVYVSHFKHNKSLKGKSFWNIKNTWYTPQLLVDCVSVNQLHDRNLLIDKTRRRKNIGLNLIWNTVFLYSYINSNGMFFLAITRPPICPAHIQMIC